MKKYVYILCMFLITSVCYAESENINFFCSPIKKDVWQCKPFNDNRYFVIKQNTVYSKDIADNNIKSLLVLNNKYKSFPFYDYSVLINFIIKDRGKLHVFATVKKDYL